MNGDDVVRTFNGEEYPARDAIQVVGLDLPCGRCHADAGEACRTRGGRPARWLHEDRVWLLREAFSAGYDVGWQDCLENENRLWQKAISKAGGVT